MRFLLFLTPFLVLIVIASLLPFLRVSVKSLPVGTVLTYDRTGGPNNYNDHISIDKDGNVYQNGYFAGTVPTSVFQDLTLYLDSNTYQSMVESLYDRYRKAHPQEVDPTNSLEVKVVVRGATGTMQIAPNTFINNMLRPYISITP